MNLVSPALPGTSWSVKVVSDRSKKSSTIVTTNLQLSKWTKLVECTILVIVVHTRLTFQIHVTDMYRDSYPLNTTMQSMK